MSPDASTAPSAAPLGSVQAGSAPGASVQAGTVQAHWRSADFTVEVAGEQHAHLAQTIVDEMAESAKARGTGIAKRSPDYVAMKMREGKAVIALAPDGRWAGFCYVESWSHGEFVANSGLIVAPAYRKFGLATRIKQRIFQLSRQLYPEAKIFGLTTGLAVMKINSELGYEPVTYSELTQDEEFWKGCQTCVNYEILKSKERKMCMCTAMLFDPKDAAAKEAERAAELAAEQAAEAAPAMATAHTAAQDAASKKVKAKKSSKWKWVDPRIYERYMRVKLVSFLSGEPKSSGGSSGTAKGLKRFLLF